MQVATNNFRSSQRHGLDPGPFSRWTPIADPIAGSVRTDDRARQYSPRPLAALDFLSVICEQLNTLAGAPEATAPVGTIDHLIAAASWCGRAGACRRAVWASDSAGWPEGAPGEEIEYRSASPASRREFRSVLRRFLEDRSPTTVARRLMETETGWDRDTLAGGQRDAGGVRGARPRKSTAARVLAMSSWGSCWRRWGGRFTARRILRLDGAGGDRCFAGGDRGAGEEGPAAGHCLGRDDCHAGIRRTERAVGCGRL